MLGFLGARAGTDSCPSPLDAAHPALSRKARKGHARLFRLWIKNVVQPTILSRARREKNRRKIQADERFFSYLVAVSARLLDWLFGADPEEMQLGFSMQFFPGQHGEATVEWTYKGKPAALSFFRARTRDTPRDAVAVAGAGASRRVPALLPRAGANTIGQTLSAFLRR